MKKILLASILIGAGIGYVDSRPNWDDTGITAGALFLSGAALAAARPRWFWLTSLALGAPVVAWNVVLHGNYGAALAMVIALVGAGLGAVSSSAISGTRRRGSPRNISS